MLKRIGGLSGLFVLITLGWYLVFPFITGCDLNTTAPERDECEELITPVMSFLCCAPAPHDRHFCVHFNTRTKAQGDAAKSNG